MRLGAITLVVMLVIMAAAFNLSKFPGFGGTSYTAEFSDASGIHRGNMVQVGGIRVGRVQDVALEDSTVIVKFEVDHGVEFGKESSASIEVLNLLGEKYLELTPAGEGQLAEDTADPARAHRVGVRHRRRLRRPHHHHRGDRHATSWSQALDVVSTTMNQAAPGDRGQLRRHRPALGDRRLAGRADPGAARELQGRHRSCSATAARTSSR